MDFPTGRYLTILADPPWQEPMMGRRIRTKGGGAPLFPYPTMSLPSICALPVEGLAGVGCHLWLWTTNGFLCQGFEVMERWGFKYLAPLHWIKPSGFGNYVIHRSQTLLLGYRGKCVFDRLRYFPNLIMAAPRKHSQKPAEAYELIERVSHGPRLELFARQQRDGWTSWGDEVGAHKESYGQVDEAVRDGERSSPALP